jgi:hypothetical protein
MDDYRDRLQIDCFPGVEMNFTYEADLGSSPSIRLYQPIPEIFHSLYDGPFTHCVACRAELAALPQGYFILRSFRHEEPVTEYAICIGCNDRFWSSTSQESRARINAEFRRSVDLDQRRNRLLSTAPLEADAWIAECLLTRKPLAECDSYLLMARCHGHSLVYGDWPWMRSGESQLHTWQMWSSKSRGRYDDFVEHFLGPTPSLAKELPKLLVPPSVSPTLPAASFAR